MLVRRKMQSELLVENRQVDTAELRLATIIAQTVPSCVGLLRDRLMSAFEDFSVQAELGKAQICMALEEALANAYYHGNLELDSKLKEDGASEFMNLARERTKRSPWNNRVIRVTELATPYGVWMTIGDEGNGFDVATALKRTEDPMSMLASGRGLVMMKAFSDELVFNAAGNEVTLVVYSKSNVNVAELLQERAATRSRPSGQLSLV